MIVKTKFASEKVYVFQYFDLCFNLTLFEVSKFNKEG